MAFLSPVEDGVHGGRFANPRTGLFSVAMAQPWRQAFDSPQGIILEDDGFISTLSSGESFKGQAVKKAISAVSSNPFGDARFVPSDRDGSRAVFSGSEQTVYLVGGLRDTSITGEIWKFDLQSGIWANLFLGIAPSTLPGEVKAISYNEENQQILMIDDGVVMADRDHRNRDRNKHDDKKWGPFHKGEIPDELFRHSRLVSIDTQTRAITQLAKLVRSDRFSRVSLVQQRR